MSDELSSGWTLDPHIGAVCHFRHMPLLEAEYRTKARSECYVVETVHRTVVTSEPDSCHFKEYFARDLPSAIALAARMEIEFREVAEDVIGIRTATESEAARFFGVHEHIDKLLPPALSDQEADALGTE